MPNPLFATSVVFIVAIASNLSSCFIRGAVWTAVETQIRNDPFAGRYLEDIKHVLDNASSFNRYSTEGVREFVEGGLVLDVLKDKNKFWAKLLLEEDSGFSKCEAFKVFEKEDFSSIKYVQKMPWREAFTGKILNKEDNSLKREVHACIAVFEAYGDGASLKDAKIFESESRKNWPVLFRFFGRLIQAVAEINFRAKLLHGDIRPENIILMAKRDSNLKLMDVEPAVFNFDSYLENSIFVNKKDPKLRYALAYRAPEMRQATTMSSKFSEDDWRQNWEKYEFSGQLVEDTYALGVTIKEVLKQQKNNVDEGSAEYRDFKALVDTMTTDRYKEPYVKGKNLTMLRPSMKTVIWELGLIMTRCEVCKADKLTTAVKDEVEAVSHFVNRKQGFV